MSGTAGSRCLLLLASVLCWMNMEAAQAHHSPAAFNTEITDFALEGVIVSADFRNPHSAMTLLVTDEQGEESEWEIEFSSINLLFRRGWDFERLKAGERVRCIGNPGVSDKPEMYMWSIVLADGTEFGR